MYSSLVLFHHILATTWILKYLFFPFHLILEPVIISIDLVFPGIVLQVDCRLVKTIHVVYGVEYNKNIIIIAVLNESLWYKVIVALGSYRDAKTWYFFPIGETLRWKMHLELYQIDIFVRLLIKCFKRIFFLLLLSTTILSYYYCYTFSISLIFNLVQWISSESGC